MYANYTQSKSKFATFETNAIKNANNHPTTATQSKIFCFFVLREHVADLRRSI